MFERFFRLSEHQTSARTEFLAGVTAFLTSTGIPLSHSIIDGLALGLISHPLMKLCSGRGREIGWLAYRLAVVLIAYFLFVQGQM